jgi:hypothetical protein
MGIMFQMTKLTDYDSPCAVLMCPTNQLYVKITDHNHCRDFVPIVKLPIILFSIEGKYKYLKIENEKLNKVISNIRGKHFQEFKLSFMLVCY